MGFGDRIRKAVSGRDYSVNWGTLPLWVLIVYKVHQTSDLIDPRWLGGTGNVSKEAECLAVFDCQGVVRTGRTFSDPPGKSL